MASAESWCMYSAQSLLIFLYSLGSRNRLCEDFRNRFRGISLPIGDDMLAVPPSPIINHSSDRGPAGSAALGGADRGFGVIGGYLILSVNC
jgi:hypothetical protein